jgi:hypothetical protein
MLGGTTAQRAPKTQTEAEQQKTKPKKEVQNLKVGLQEKEASQE